MAQRTGELLDREYLAMDDTELQSYFLQLSDQLAHESRAARISDRENSGPSREGSGAEGDAANPENLRQRWNDVRQELRRRDRK